MRSFVIVADDIGLSRGVTDTILQVADTGAVDGVSIIANGEALPYALAEIQKRPALKVALHANLTEGKALTRGPLLTTPEGFFRYGPLQLWMRYLCALPAMRASLRAQVRQELAAQREAVGKTVERADGHQHVHMVPFVFDELVALSGIRRVRLAREPLYTAPGKPMAFLRRALPVIGLSLLAIRNRRKAAQRGILTNDYCLGVLYSGHMNADALTAGSAALPTDAGEVEVVLHPGEAKKGELEEWRASGADADWLYSPRRGEERAMLTTPGFTYFLTTPDDTHGRFARFIIAGATAAFVHITALLLLMEYGWGYLAATSVGFCTAFVVSFSLQKWWTFKDKGGHVHRKLVAYLTLQLGNLLLNATGMYLFVHVLRVPVLLSQVLVLMMLAFSTYLLSSMLFAGDSRTRDTNTVRRKIMYLANMRMPTERAHGVQIAKACEAFAAAGADVELVVPRRYTPITEEPFAYYGIATPFAIRFLHTPDVVRSFGRFGFLLQILFFSVVAARYVRTQKYDVVYSRDEHVLFLALLLGTKRVVWESHDGAWNFSARSVARRAERMVVVTRAQKEFYHARGVADEKMLAVPNGVDVRAFAHTESKESARHRLGVPKDTFLALYVGAFGGWKGTDTLLEASRLLSTGIRVAMIGGYPKQVEPLRKKYPNVMFVGEHPYRELPDNLAAADVLVLPNTGRDPVSVSFTSPLKLLAYMAAGKPIVASDLPSVRELTGDTAAVLVEPDSPQALAGGIERVANDTALANRLTQDALARVQEFDWQTRAERLLAFVAPVR